MKEFLKKYARGQFMNIGFWTACAFLIATILRSEILQLVLVGFLMAAPNDLLKSIADKLGKKAEAALRDGK